MLNLRQKFSRLPQAPSFASPAARTMVALDAATSLMGEDANAAADDEYSMLHEDARLAADSARARSQGPWTKNLHFRPPSGFWGDAEWYDLQLERRLPEVKPMLDEVVFALPPLGGGGVCDVCAGSGRASAAIRAAYPRARLTLVDVDAGRLDIAARRVAPPATFVAAPIAPEAPTLPEAPHDAVVLVLALRHVVAPAPHYADRHGLAVAATIGEAYRALFNQIFCSLRPGGHVVLGDHVEHGHPSVFEHMVLLRECGFEDVDVAWRRRDYFVVGARAPLGVEIELGRPDQTFETDSADFWTNRLLSSISRSTKEVKRSRTRTLKSA